MNLFIGSSFQSYFFLENNHFLIEIGEGMEIYRRVGGSGTKRCVQAPSLSNVRSVCPPADICADETLWN